MSGWAELCLASLLCLAATLLLIRLALGPTLHDRTVAGVALLMLFALSFATAAVLLRAPALLDVALAGVAIAGVAGAALFKAHRRRSLQPPLTGPRTDGPATKVAP